MPNRFIYRPHSRSVVCATATLPDVFAMNWTNDLVLRFLELYQMHPCIWDPKNAFHKNRTEVNDAWDEIRHRLECSGTIKELKKKRDSLMAAYRGYKIKIKKSEKSGTGTGDIYQPSWYAFAIMDSFLASIYTCKETANSENEEPEENLDQDDQTVGPDPDADTNASNSEQDSAANTPCQFGPVNQGPLTSQQRTMTTSKRRQNDPPELQQATQQSFEVLNILKTMSQRSFDEDDECNLFGKLVAKKLRRLPDDRRDLMMIKISEQIYAESQLQNRTKSSTPMSSHKANT